MNNSELQREYVLRRWNKNDELDRSRAISDINERNKLYPAVIAYLQGDGSVIARKVAGKMRYDMQFYPDDLTVANLFIEMYQKLYGRQLKISPRKNFFVLRTTQKIAYEDLSRLARFKSLEWEIPSSILDTNEKKKSWLRAFFDCEAYVGKGNIVIQSVNKLGLEQVKDLLSHFGINTRSYTYQRKQTTWNVNYLLVISRRENRQSFLKQIGFNHSKKQEKLEKSLADVA